MNVNRRYVWTAGGLLTVALLVFLWRGSESNSSPAEVRPDSVSETRIQPSQEEFQHHRHAHKEECASCPDIREDMKRKGPSEEDQTACDEFLEAAAMAGIPFPDTGHLGDCNGDTPLHFARTPDQVRDLLTSGSDPNVANHVGHTPLATVILHGALLGVETAEESDRYMEMTRLLLEGGADSYVKTTEGVRTISRLLNNAIAANASSHLIHQKRVEAADDLRQRMGVEEVPEIDANLRKSNARIQERYLHMAKTEKLLQETWAEGQGLSP